MGQTEVISAPLSRALRAMKEDTPVNDLLSELVNQFVADAKAVDPTITAVWVGRDEAPDLHGRPFYISFERKGGFRAA